MTAAGSKVASSPVTTRHHREDEPAEDHLEARGDERSAGQGGAP